ncbi:MAG: DUF992 domain-containing protein [Hyphomicrobium sp.]|uniref:DUF992 domain-containing protein n=1 Tax=Hyphomicrobium sp. TaxID=82 RepID=UPI0035635430
MKPSLAKTSSILAAAVAVLAAASLETKPATAAPKITLGTLKCKGHGGVGLILGSKERMHCVFTTAVSARRHPYLATITKIGLDIGFTGESTLIWTVLGTTVDVAEGALEGGYGGLTAGLAVGIGANANALIGGSGKSIVLQPISVEGQTGLNLSAGVAGLTLERG